MRINTVTKPSLMPSCCKPNADQVEKYPTVNLPWSWGEEVGNRCPWHNWLACFSHNWTPLDNGSINHNLSRQFFSQGRPFKATPKLHLCNRMNIFSPNPTQRYSIPSLTLGGEMQTAGEKVITRLPDDNVYVVMLFWILLLYIYHMRIHQTTLYICRLSMLFFPRFHTGTS